MEICGDSKIFLRLKRFFDELGDAAIDINIILTHNANTHVTNIVDQQQVYI